MFTLLTISSAALTVQMVPPPPSPDYTLMYMHRERRNETNPEDPFKRHTPPVRMKCFICAEGEIIMEGIDIEDITDFEIWTPEGIRVASLDSKEEFIETFYTLSGEFEIRFLTEEYVITGYTTNNY